MQFIVILSRPNYMLQLKANHHQNLLYRVKWIYPLKVLSVIFCAINAIKYRLHHLIAREIRRGNAIEYAVLTVHIAGLSISDKSCFSVKTSMGMRCWTRRTSPWRTPYITSLFITRCISNILWLNLFFQTIFGSLISTESMLVVSDKTGSHRPIHATEIGKRRSVLLLKMMMCH